MRPARQTAAACAPRMVSTLPSRPPSPPPWGAGSSPSKPSSDGFFFCVPIAADAYLGRRRRLSRGDQGHPLPRRRAHEDPDDAGGEQVLAHAAIAVHPHAAGACERRYFHTSRTMSMTSSSLRRVSSWVTVWPEPPPLEKPHCGERPRRSSGTYFAASSMRRLRASLLSSCGVLVETRPRMTVL